MQEQVCKNCGNHFTGKFCNNCGEKVYSDKDKVVSHLVEEGFHFITHFEGTFFTSLKNILFRPGKLSQDFCNGIRKRYFKPLSFFLMLVILYLLFPLFEGLNMRLQYYTVNDFYGKYALQKTQEVMQKTGMTWDQLSEAFHHKGEKISKFLLFTIIPFMAAVSWLLGFKKRRFYYDHFIFSTEAGSFFIMAGFLIFPMILLLLRAITGTFLLDKEIYVGLLILAAMFSFLIIGTIRFFKFSVWYSILYSVIYLGTMMLFLNYIYKFVLFFIAINQL
ncbi:MAG: DUF3667 domain-containing protein [Chitinophagaceae bacterium]|nr:MAG: DUF3667 domain-containing protein [Chitinophagaceae bacterium]